MIKIKGLLKKRWIRALIIFLIIVIGLIIIRPSDKGAPYSKYFEDLNTELRQKGYGRPVLIIDLDKIDKNLDVVKQSITSPLQFRIVVKSIPSLDLVKYIMQKTGTARLMVFHQPHMNILARSGLKGIDLLVGKPMPINSVNAFYRDLHPGFAFDPSKQVQWLVDTPERVSQYLAFAYKKKIRLQLNIEIDVGLHRGGVTDLEDLNTMLKTIAHHQEFLTLSGFMGYEAHIGSVPAILTSKVSAMKGAHKDVLERYRRYVNFSKKHYPSLFKGEMTYNSGGSTTYKLYTGQEPINDIALGSGIVKPSDFDTVLLEDHAPAVFIATPVLKKLKGTTIPFLEKITGIFSIWNPNKKVTYFIYGGGWLAKPVAPEGIESNAIYGFSTNQAILNGSEKTGLQVDDHIFFRPMQSEKVLLDFGDILVFRNGMIIDTWPAFRK